MNKTVLITGANVGLGKETARQLAAKTETEKIYLACRNPKKALTAKQELEKETGKKIFEIVIMDVSSIDSVELGLQNIDKPVDAVILNAGGLGGLTPGKITSSGMNDLAAVNLLGHAYLVESMLEKGMINKAVLLASSEAARGIKVMGMKRPALKDHSVKELSSILDGSYWGQAFDVSQAYGHVKYVGTLWMSSLSRKYPSIKFISMSPGATSGTAAADNIPLINKIMFKYVMMPIILPLRGMIHSIDKGAKRFVDGISNMDLESGKFYASVDGKVTGKVVDQSSFFPALANKNYQDNAAIALRGYLK